MAVRILVDASADISKVDAVKMGIEIIPMPVTIDGQEYLAGLNIDNDEFYRLLKTAKEFPKTSQLTPKVFLEYYKTTKSMNDELIVMTISSALSGTYHNGVLAKELIGYNNIYVIDSLSASVGMRLLVELAVKLKNDGLTAPLIYEEIEKIKVQTRLLAMVDTLAYLHKGGRLSKKQAVIGNLMSVKPILTFQSDGSLTVIEKAIGKTRAVKEILKSLEKEPIDTNYPLYFVYSVYEDDAKKLATKIKESHQLDFSNNCCEIGPVIGAHVGPGALGIVYVKKNVTLK